MTEPVVVPAPASAPAPAAPAAAAPASPPAAATPPAAPAVAPAAPAETPSLAVAGAPPAPKSDAGAPAAEAPKPGDPAPAAPVTPKASDLKLPEGSFLDPKDVERVAAEAAELKLDTAGAQKLLERDNAAVGRFVESQKAQVKASLEGWIAAAKADPEIAGPGGTKFAESLELSKRGFDHAEKVVPGLTDFLNRTGLGNSPHAVKLGRWIGSQIKDDSFVPAGRAPAGERLPDSKVFYK